MDTEGSPVYSYPTPKLVSQDELLARLRKGVESSRRKRLERYSPEALAWLALPPLWSEELAATIKFPVESNLLDFLDEAEDIGLVERSVPEVSGGMQSYYQAQALVAIAPHLSDKLVNEALNVALEIKNETGRADALAALAPHLPDALWRQAWENAIELVDDHDRARALLELAGSAPSALRETLVDLLLTALGDPGAAANRVRDLAGGLLAEILPSSKSQGSAQAFLSALTDQLVPIGKAVAASGTLRLFQVVLGIMVYLDETRQVQVKKKLLALARKLTSPGLRASLLAELASRAGKDEAAALAQESLVSVLQIPTESERSVALLRLNELLPGEVLLTSALAFQEERQKASIISALAPSLKETELAQALQSSSALTDEDARLAALSALAPYLPEADASRVLALGAGFSREGSRAWLLRRLAPALRDRPRLAEQAIEMAGALVEPAVRAAALSGLAPILPPQIARRAFDLCLEIKEKEPAGCSIALADLLPTLTEDLRLQAFENSLEAARRIDEDDRHAKALANLAERAIQAGMADKLEAIRSQASLLANERSAAQALVRLAAAQNPQDRLGTLQLVLQIVAAIDLPGERAQARLEILPLLSQEGELEIAETLASQTLEDLSAEPDPEARSRLLISLAPFLSAGLMPDALDVVSGFHPSRQFWIPDRLRAETLKDLETRLGREFLEKTATEIGYRVTRPRRNLPIPAALARWSALAFHLSERTGTAARWFSQRIQRLVDSGDTASALTWLKTAQSLAEALGGEMESAVLTGNRRLELAFRKRQDERRLLYFLERPDQTRAFLDLLNDSDDQPWALHFLGMGGVGKTMLMRFITSRLARQAGVLTARVDFDHLNPDYPVHKPGQLLLELAQELSLYQQNPELDRYYIALDDRVRDLHEYLSRETVARHPLEVIHNDEFSSIRGAFRDFLRALNKRVVLILDTAEELAKAQIAGRQALNVRVTFEILKIVHEDLPSIRVVFAGRRLLALSGANYIIHIPEDIGVGAQPASSALNTPAQLIPEVVKTVADLDLDRLPDAKRALPESAPFLRLFEVRGFTEKEADAYLVDICRLNLAPGMRQAILDASEEVGTAAQVDWLPPHPEEPEIRLFNPFDLALYAQLVDELPDLAPIDLVRGPGKDPYIDIRILSRLRQEELVRLMPAVVLLRRFDRDMLRGALRLPKEEFEDVFRELGDQEWLDYQPDAALATTFLEVDRSLFPRLWEYYQAARYKTDMDEARVKLGRRLRAIFRPGRCRLDRLNEDHFNAALSCLAPAQGAALWENTILRIPDEMKWDSFQTVLKRLLASSGAEDATPHASPQKGRQLSRRGSPPEASSRLPWQVTADQGAIGDRAHPLWAGVVGASLAARLHAENDYPKAVEWADVEEQSIHYPDPYAAAWLARRARLGQEAAFWRQPWTQPDLLTDAGFHKGVLGQLQGMGAQYPPLAGDLRSFVKELGPCREVLAEFPSLVAEAGNSAVLGGGPAGRYRVEQLAASLCAALDARINWLETSHGQLSDDYSALILGWIDALEQIQAAPELLLYARLLLARCLALARLLPEADEQFKEAAALLDKVDSKKASVRWADWLPPGSLVDRLRLEWLLRRFGYDAPDVGSGPNQVKLAGRDDLPDGAPPNIRLTAETLLVWQKEAEARLEEIDAERLVSRMVIMQLAAETIPLEEVRRLQGIVVYQAGRKPVCAAHQAVPPLFANVANALTALGRGEEAVEWVNQCIKRAEDSRTDPETVLAGQRAQLFAVRRTRLYDRKSHTTEVLSKSTLPDDQALAWPVVNLVGGKHSTFLPSELDPSWQALSLHLWWASQARPTKDACRLFLQQSQGEAQSPPDGWPAAGFAELSLALDREEATLLVQGGIPLAPAGLDLAALHAWGEFYAGQPEEAARLWLRSFALFEQGLTPPPEGRAVGQTGLADKGIAQEGAALVSQLPVGIGQRRWLELAIEEGELLDLRLPSQALRLLQRFPALLVNVGLVSGDNLPLLLQLHVLAGCAAARSGKLDSARQALSEIEVSYQKFSESGDKPLPAWKALVDLANSPSLDAASLTSAISSLEWRGWLLRILSLLIWDLEKSGGAAPRTLAFLAAVQSLHSLTLPVELNLASIPKVKGDMGIDIPQPSKASGLSTFILTLVGFLILAGTVVGSYFLLIWLFGLIYPPVKGLNTAIKIGIWAGTLLILLLVRTPYRWLSSYVESWLASLSHGTLSIRSQASDWLSRTSFNPIPANFSLTINHLSLTIRALFPIITKVDRVDADGISPGFGPYAESAKNMPAALIDPLLAWQKRLGKKFGTLAIEADSAAAPDPWEAFITLALQPSPNLNSWKSGLRFLRMGPPHLKGKDRLLRAKGKVLALVNPSWRSVAEQGWKGMPEFSIVEAISMPQDQEPVRVLHLMGSAVRATAGLRFQVIGASEPEYVQKAQKLPSRSSSLLSSEDMAVATVGLVVVQGEPGSDISVRFETDREMVAGLRSFAAELFADDAPAVLVLPPLPPELAIRTLQLVSAELGARRDGSNIRHLDNLVSNIRHEIAVWQPPVDSQSKSVEPASGGKPPVALNEILVEKALDVTLFAREEGVNLTSYKGTTTD